MSAMAVILYIIDVPMFVILIIDIGNAAGDMRRQVPWRKSLLLFTYLMFAIMQALALAVFHFRDPATPGNILVLLFLSSKSVEGHRLKFYRGPR